MDNLSLRSTFCAALAAGSLIPLAAQTTPGRDDIALIVPGYVFWAFDYHFDRVFDNGEQWGLPGDHFLAGQPLRAYRDLVDELVVVRGGDWWVKINDLPSAFSGRYVRLPFSAGLNVSAHCLCDIDGDGLDNAITMYATQTVAPQRRLRIDRDANLVYGYPDTDMGFPISWAIRDRLLGGRLGAARQTAELAVFRDASGHWDLFTTYQGTPTPAMFARPQFGLPGDLPMLGDANGDGADDLMVFRPSMNWLFINYWEAGQSMGGYGPDGDVDRTVDYGPHVRAINQALGLGGRAWDLGAVAVRIN